MARSGGGNRGCRHVNWLMYYGQPAAGPTLGYGLLYNWYAATDVRGVAPDGWRVPSPADFTTLSATISSDFASLKSARVLADGDPYWVGGGEGTNTTDFNGNPAGIRNNFDGNYSNFRTMLRMWTTTSMTVYVLSDVQNGPNGSSLKTGLSIRCVRDTEPPAATVTDIDGNIYNWVQIGTQYWLTNNLKTTKYNNGDSIATGLDDAAWAATTDGAWAYPNGDQNLPI